MTFFHLWLVFWGGISSQNISQLDYLRPWTLLAKDMIDLLRKYNLREKHIVYVKDERFKLDIMTWTLKFVINCNILG
jgi:hypothetical protein